MMIGIVGFAGSGKDTIGDMLVDTHGYSKDSFANTLKSVVAEIFAWDRDMMEGATPESREWREQVDVWWSEKLGIPEFTPRYAMQYIGTDVLRNNFCDKLWLLGVERRLMNSCEDVVITDCRFPNEIELIRKMGGEIWHVERGERPSWYDVAENANIRNSESDRALMEHYYAIHPSEWAWIGIEPDIRILNDTSIIELGHKVYKTLYNR